MSDLREKVNAAPLAPGCYVIRDKEGTVLYVGKARALRRRLQTWFGSREKHSPWVETMMSRAADFDVVLTDTEVESLILEANLIKEHRPRFNVKLADDKSYPYLKLTLEEEFPRLMVVRALPKEAKQSLKQVRSERGFSDSHHREVHFLSKGRYFGPYASAKSMRRTMRLLSQLFGIRQCRRKLDGTKKYAPCLNYHMQRCLAPCAGQCTKEEYWEAVGQAIKFLEGRQQQIVAELEAEMTRAAQEMEFERAARYRDKLRAVRRVLEEQKVTSNQARDEDVLGLAVADDRACVQAFQIRQGQMVGQEQFMLERATDRDRGEILEYFVERHYAEATHIPKAVYVSESLEGADLLREWLSRERGSAVKVVRPQRGEKRRLVELAVRNAGMVLERVAQSRHERERIADLTLSELQEALGMERQPRRIECYDISTLSGRESVGSMVVFVDAAQFNSGYRRFRMKLTEGKADDFAMLQEMIARRLGKARQGDEKFLPLPDLMLIDGGKGQVSSVVAVLEEMGVQDIAVAGLAKQFEEVYVPGRSAPVVLAEGGRAHNLLRRMRDEAHRFAQGYHHKLREKKTSKSLLDEVPGIGPTLKRRLLQHFKSIEVLKQASAEELAAVPGMTRQAAQDLKEYLGSG